MLSIFTTGILLKRVERKQKMVKLRKRNAVEILVKKIRVVQSVVVRKRSRKALVVRMSTIVQLVGQKQPQVRVRIISFFISFTFHFILYLLNILIIILIIVADAVASVLPALAGITHPSDVLDMPVDPNEPTYCLCHQVSYGEMIGCDNLDVSEHQTGIFRLIITFSI